MGAFPDGDVGGPGRSEIRLLPAVGRGPGGGGRSVRANGVLIGIANPPGPASVIGARSRRSRS